MGTIDDDAAAGAVVDGARAATDGATPGAVRRPRDRRQTIARNAGALFAERGFDSVRMEDIAAASGITARAVYRHFASKQALLSHIIRTSQSRFLDAVDAAGGADRTDGLQARLERLAAASLDSPHFAVLWQREARHLADDDLEDVRARLNGMALELARAIRAAAPELSEVRAEIRAWVALAILSSPGHHDAVIARPAYDRLLVAACRAAIATPVGPSVELRATGDGARRSRGGAGSRLVSRREQLLATAADAFRRNGFQSVGVNEIGAAAGIAGPNVYRYFSAKSDILVALTRRYQEWIAHETFRAVQADGDGSPLQVLRCLVEGYTSVAAECPDLVAVAVTEWSQLPDGEAEQYIRARNDHLAEWAHWVTACRPDAGRAEVALLVRIATILIDDSVRIPHLLRQPGIEDELAGSALNMLARTDIDATRPAPSVPS
ncbi:TetR/AcrR family transcriptional regulator [Tsukamurella soli]|uniref:TetR family transcriptional regulator Mce3R n=1 Tax=Tsukamurella soli TaxID=644556 RepID=A0ABP8JS61_9ACTN